MQPTNFSTSFNFDGNLTSNCTTILDSNLTSNNTSRDLNVLAPCLVLGLCFLVGLPCNIAVIVTLAKKIKHMTLKENESFSLKLILSLAVSDTLSLSTIPLVIYVLTYEWTLGPWMCGLSTYGLYCCLYGSVLNVTLIGVHRHCIAKNETRNTMSNNPSKERHLKERHNKMLVGLWVLVCVLAFPIVFTRGVEPKRGRLRCQRSTMFEWEKVSILLMETIFGFVIPFSILATCYFCFQKRTKPKDTEEECSMHRNAVSRHQRMKNLVTSILVTFFIVWMPVNIINTVDIAAILVRTAHPRDYHNIKYFRRMVGDNAKALILINSCLNPFLYAFVYERQKRIKPQDQNQTNPMNATSV
ncbi:apelin receptor-like [Oncorhynchus masou masou]|uniref:apelin receptor-like n=1 Tax=Oncorhynchus masou masou TaxID=90313 RepID=UPI0031834019